MAIDVDMAAEDDVAELEDWLEVFDWWQPAPTNANTAIAAENDAVLLVIARIFSSRIPFESHRTRPGRRALIFDSMPIRSCAEEERADP
jgi:hypothetical protein